MASKSYAVSAAACYLNVPGSGVAIFYAGAPVPEGATKIGESDLGSLEEDGFIVPLKDGQFAGGHPSDHPDREPFQTIGDDEQAKPGPRKTAASAS